MQAHCGCPAAWANACPLVLDYGGCSSNRTLRYYNLLQSLTLNNRLFPMPYEHRTYRDYSASDGLVSFTVAVKETDLFISAAAQA